MSAQKCSKAPCILLLPRSAFDRDQIAGNMWRSGTSLIAITWLRRLSLSRLLYKLGLSWHLETVINCTVMHATWWGGWELSQHQQLVVRCGGDPGVTECTVQQWVVAGKTNSGVSYYQTNCSGCHGRTWPWATSAAKWLHGVLYWMFNCYSLGGASDSITADRDHWTRSAVMTSRWSHRSLW